MTTETAINIGRIKATINLQTEISELKATWDELTEPTITDLSLLPMFYNLYLSMFERRRNPSNIATKAYHRRKFLMAVLYLYSPRTFAGGKMVVGLRDKIGELFNLQTKTPISDNVSDLLLYYEKYRDFRKDVDFLYREFLQALEVMKNTDFG